MRPMSIRPFRRLPLALGSALLLAGRVALAADPVGSWAVDTAALKAELERLVQADLARMSASERAQMGPALAGQLDELVRRSAGTAEFRRDGTVLLQGSHDGTRQTGRWTLDGDRVRLVPDDHRKSPFAGAVEGDTMRLKPEREVEEFGGLVLKRQ